MESLKKLMEEQEAEEYLMSLGEAARRDLMKD